ncbi:FxsA family protein [Azospirillum thermophilum]|uniref:Exclusion protein FxsA n=1 Tax=Azospirillum thermophilum TaxID=2202148 RepID=A0A2S2CNY8_9PROT|nr:FxsA family protein [Azospirillum thermophilum]AWK86037.1 exclusion protein FxsA [Azospirillum thermophilum]
MNPLLSILLLPVVEIIGFIVVGDWIGAGPTIGLLILSLLVGSALIRRQGVAAVGRAQGAMQRGETPMGAVFDGFCKLVAGVLLVIPGFVTDILALILLIPPVRRGLGLWLLARLARSGSFQMWSSGTVWRDPPDAGEARRPPPGVIDVDYRDVTADERDGRRDGPDGPALSDSRWGQDRRDGR